MLEITKDDVALRRQPDAQFQHDRAAYPGVVIEVSYSQDGKDLDKLAWNYIQGSNGDIKVVIGIDINLGASPSTISLWRRKCYFDGGNEVLDVELEVENDVSLWNPWIEYAVLTPQPFLSSLGDRVNEEKQVSIKITDFATDALCLGLDEQSLSIQYQELAEYVHRAKRIQETREVAGLGKRTTRLLTKRKRYSTPPEQINDDDEANFRKKEHEAMRRADAKDNDYE